MRHSNLLEVNEFLVLDLVRERAQTTRPDIEKALGLSSASVSRIVTRLLRSGLVNEETGVAGSPGRTAALIAFNPRAGSVVAIDLGGTKCHGALADLTGTIVAEHLQPTHTDGSPYDSLLATYGALRAEADRRGLPVAALAVGVPAIIDPETGVAIEGPNVSWSGFELTGQLGRDIDVPFAVDNDVNLAALAQAWRGQGRDVADFVTISIGTGIGAAVVAHGRLVKGRHNAAGEVGYLVLNREQLHEEQPVRDRLGGFERVAAGPAIARRAESLLEGVHGPDSVLVPGHVTPEAVFAAAGAGDLIARQVIDETLDYVAIALIAVIATVDPARVILDGGVGRSLEPYVGELANLIRPHWPAVPEIVVSQLGPTATVVGAIATGLRLVRRNAAPSVLLETFTESQVAADGA
jgi:glucokinase